MLKVLFFKVTHEILPISSHRVLKRYVFKGRDLITLVIFTASKAFLNETGFFFFLLLSVSEMKNTVTIGIVWCLYHDLAEVLAGLSVTAFEPLLPMSTQ